MAPNMSWVALFSLPLAVLVSFSAGLAVLRGDGSTLSSVSIGDC